jgi:hypothetical protein
MKTMTESETDVAARKRITRQRNLVLAGLLVGWVVLIYAVSIVRMG